MPSLLLRRGLVPALAAVVLSTAVPAAVAPAALADPGTTSTAAPSPTPEPTAAEPAGGPTDEPTVQPSAGPTAETIEPTAEPSAEQRAVQPAPEQTAASSGSLAAADATQAEAAAVPAANPVAARAAADWLAGRLDPETGLVEVSFDGGETSFTDFGRSLDSALALLAERGEDDTLRRTLASVTAPEAVTEYTQGAPYDGADAAYAGATAKLATVVALTGGDPRDVGGVDLLDQLAGLTGADGRVVDRSDYGDYANTFGQAFAVLAYAAAGETVPANLLAFLRSVACSDGSFAGALPEDGVVCEGDIDATGLVLQALAAAGLGDSAEATAAADWLEGQQQADGSFPGEVPVNSTGYAVLGLNAVGRTSPAGVAYLTSQQNLDGGLRRGVGDDQSSDLFATAQALPALVGTTFLAAARDVTPASQPAPTTPGPTTPAPTTPTASPAAAAGVTASPSPTTGGGGPAGGSSTRTTSGSLPRTGAGVDALLPVAAVALALGSLLLVAVRRRRA